MLAAYSWFNLGFSLSFMWTVSAVSVGQTRSCRVAKIVPNEALLVELPGVKSFARCCVTDVSDSFEDSPFENYRANTVARYGAVSLAWDGFELKSFCLGFSTNWRTLICSVGQVKDLY